MSDDGTSFTIDLPVTGQSQIDAASSSVDTLAARLGDTSVASRVASDAVKLAESAYRKSEQSADKLAKALERVGLAADVQRGKLRAATDAKDEKGAERAAARLRDLTVEQAVLTSKTEQAKETLTLQAEILDSLAAKASKAKQAEAQLAEAEAKAAKAGKDVASAAKEATPEVEKNEIAFEKISRGLNKIGGPLAEVGHRALEVGAGFGKLGKSLGESGKYLAIAGVLAAITAAMVALTAATAAAILKIGEWAVTLTDANRSAELLSEGMVRSVKGGQELNDKINYLTSKLPLTREEIASTAEQLAHAGLRGKDLGNALQYMTVRAANLKFGPDWSKQMLSLGEQSKVLSFNLSRIFGQLNIEGLLKALQTLGALLDEDTASGHAIKVVFESLFQPVVDGAAKSGTKIEAFFLQLEIWALKALIWFKPHASLFLKIGEALAIVAGIITGTLVTAFIVLLSPIIAVVTAMTALVYQALQFKDVGKAMIAGLVNGIEAGGAAVLSAIKGVVMGAIDGAKKLLGIASPSKVFAEIGAQTGAGMAQGVDGSAGGVQNSLETMVAPPANSAQPGAPAAATKGGASVTGNTFIFNGVKDAEQAESSFADIMTRIMEGDAAQLGAVAPA